MEYRNPKDLKPHTVSMQIYGDNHIDERFIDDIKKHGIRQPLIISKENIIISGHRRWRVAKLLNIPSVPVEISSTFLDNIEEKRAIVANNLQRDKDFSQKMREAEVWKEIERAQMGPELTHEVQNEIAKKAGFGSRSTAQRAEQIWDKAKEGNVKARELIKKLDNEPDKTSIAGALKELQEYESDKQIKKVRSELASVGKLIPQSDKWHVEKADINTYNIEQRFDYIITDPPYPKEFLPLYSVLAKRAKEWLSPSGLLIVMCGQSYLDQIYEMLSEHLKYYWTSAYLTPGQPTPLRQRQVNSTWKPILIYSPNDNYKGKIFGDVYTSTNSEKDSHDWGQSVSGMLSIIKQICLPGQTIFDPFMGSGTTGVASLQHGCLFWGIDIDEQSVNISKKRMAEIK